MYTENQREDSGCCGDDRSPRPCADCPLATFRCMAPRCERIVSDAAMLCDSCQDRYWEAQS